MPAPSFGFQWHLTDRCNLRCAHCYQDNFTAQGERSRDDLQAMARAVFHSLPDRAVSINITGGEPLLFPGLWDLLDHLHTYPALEEISIITNGTVADDGIVESLARLPRVSTIKISVESCEAPVNDRIRGVGALSRVRENLGAFRRAGKSLVLMMTLGRYNLSSLGHTVCWARDHGLDGVIFERFVPLGRGKGIRDQALAPEEWEIASREIARAGGVDGETPALLPYRAFWLDVESCADPLRGAHCNLGAESMALMPDGTIYPCRRLPVAMGNILTDPFEGIRGNLRRYGPEEVRSRLRGGRCSSCDVEGCSGCRAIALALTGDALADDPQCPL